MDRSVELTDVEKVILERLQRDARLSSADLAAQLNMSNTPVWRRIKRLEESGVIRGYRAQLDPKLLGLGVQTFLSVHVNAQDEGSIQEFQAAIAAIEEIVSCHLVTGMGDYLLNVVSRDMESYAALTARIASSLPGVRDKHVALNLQTLKPFTGFPIPR